VTQRVESAWRRAWLLGGCGWSGATGATGPRS
jgi:hypothetical protein